MTNPMSDVADYLGLLAVTVDWLGRHDDGSVPTHLADYVASHPHLERLVLAGLFMHAERILDRQIIPRDTNVIRAVIASMREEVA